MDYNKTINEENIKQFKRGDIFFDTETEKYHCVLCERKVSISGSSSITGHFLICNNCAYEKFGDYAKARKWQKQLIDEEVKRNA